MPDVVMPDGTVIEDVPEGTTKRELLRRLEKMRAAPNATDATFAEGAKRGLERGLYRNVLNAPEVIAQGLLAITDERASQAVGHMGPFGLLSQGVEALTGGAVDPAAWAARQRAKGRVLPEVTPEEVFAGMRTGIGAAGALFTDEDVNLSERYQRNLAVEQGITERTSQGAPMGTAAGNVAADAATLFAGRAPLALNRARNPKAIQAAAETFANARTTFPELGRRIMKSGPVRALARGAGRAAETGIEGAALAILNDPEASREEIAAVMAGGAMAQSAGSLGLTAVKGAVKSPVKFGLATVGLIAMARQLQEFGPGANSVYDAADEIFDHAAFGLTAGMAGGLLGMGRIKPENASAAVNIVAEGLTALPRGAALSLINDAVEGMRIGDNSLERVSAAMIKNPTAFSPEQRQRFESAVKSEDTSPLAEARAMIEDQDFRERLRGVETGINAEIRQLVRADTKDAGAFRPSQTAQAVSRVLGVKRSADLGFEKGSLPREFIRKAFETAPAQLGRLGRDQFREAGGLLLERLIRDNSTDLKLDGAKFRAAWEALPEKSRKLFPERTRKAVEAFAQQTGITGVPDHLARALINPRSQLVFFNDTATTER